MKLLKEAQKAVALRKRMYRINEMAAGGATGAGGIAGTRFSLFGGVVKRTPTEQPKKKKKGRSLREYVDDKFNAVDVMSKLHAAEKKAKNDKDTVAFGLEDEEGNVIRVHVKAEQADEFEKALSGMLAGQDEDDQDEDKENTSLEIAELLFKLKDRFEIVDVDWGTIPEDQEDAETAGVEAEGEPGAGGELGAEAGAEGEPGAEAGAEDELGMEAGASAGGEEGAASALQQVIDVLKADAEAKKAEADARAAEAKAKEAEYVAQAAAHKVKQEEQVLDMETYYKNKKEKDKEVKKLGQLAKYQHDLAADKETELSGEMGGESQGGELPDISMGAGGEEQEEVMTRLALGKLLHKLLRAQH